MKVNCGIDNDKVCINISPSVSPDKLKEDSIASCKIVKVTILNEVGSLNRILKAFHVSKINVYTVYNNKIYDNSSCKFFAHYH